MNELIAKTVDALRGAKSEHIEIGKLLVSAHGGDLYGFDFLAVAALNRSMCLLRGFCDLIMSENFVAAAPLVRLQLDNCLRFYAGWLVSEPHDFAMQILDGKHVRNLLDGQGNKMTDRYLVEKFAEKEDARLVTLYNQTSGYIHLSNKHMYNAIVPEDEEGLRMKITDKDEFVPDDLYLEAVNAFAAVTKVLLKYVYGWAYTKDNPEIVRKLKEDRDTA